MNGSMLPIWHCSKACMYVSRPSHNLVWQKPKGQVNITTPHSGSRQGGSETLGCRIVVFMWSFGPPFGANIPISSEFRIKTGMSIHCESDVEGSRCTTTSQTCALFCFQHFPKSQHLVMTVEDDGQHVRKPYQAPISCLTSPILILKLCKADCMPSTASWVGVMGIQFSDL